MTRLKIELKGHANAPMYTALFADFGAAISFLCDIFEFGAYNEVAGRYSIVCWNETTKPASVAKIYYTDDLSAHLLAVFEECPSLIVC